MAYFGTLFILFILFIILIPVALIVFQHYVFYKYFIAIGNQDKAYKGAIPFAAYHEWLSLGGFNGNLVYLYFLILVPFVGLTLSILLFVSMYRVIEKHNDSSKAAIYIILLFLLGIAAPFYMYFGLIPTAKPSYVLFDFDNDVENGIGF